MSEYNIQMNKYNALNAEYDQLYPKPMKHANTHAKDGSDPITPASIGAYTKTETDTLLQNKATFLQNDKVLYVSPDGNDSTGDGSQSKPFRQIQTALNTLPKNLGGAEVTINVAAGEYNGFEIKSFNGGGRSNTFPLRIIGASADTTHITGGIEIGGCNTRVWLNSLHISGNKSGCNLTVLSSIRLFVSSCKFDDTTPTGIWAQHVETLIIFSSQISNKSGTGISSDASLCFISGLSGSENGVCIVSGNDNSGLPAIVVANQISITGTTQYAKYRGGIIFVGGASV